MELFTNKFQEGTEEIENYEIKTKESSKLLFDFERECTFRHGNKLTNLIKARILNNYTKGTTILPDTAKFVCFEIPTFIGIKELADNNVFDTLNELGKFDSLEKNVYFHLGIIDREKNIYKIYNPTNEVLGYVHEQMDSYIQNNDSLMTRRIQGEDFRKKISESAKISVREVEHLNEKRKDVYLEEQYKYKLGDKIYADYNGIDIVEGKLLKINRVSIIEKNENEILYSAFIQKIDHEYEEENESINLQDTPKGNPILFTLSNTLDNIIKNGKQKDLEKVLQLFSGFSKNISNVKRIHYIGGINEQGEILRNMENCSDIIIKKIEEQKMNFERKLEKSEIVR